MSENFNLEIISPDQILLNSEVKQVAIPAYEGMMTILKDNISLITFHLIYAQSFTELFCKLTINA